MRKKAKFFLGALIVLSVFTACTATKSEIKKTEEVKIPSEKVATIMDAENFKSALDVEDFFTGNRLGLTLDLSLNKDIHGKGTKGLSYAYDVSEEGYTGTTIKYEKIQIWSGAKGIKLFMKKDSSGNKAVLQFKEVNGEYWETSISMSKDESGEVYISMSDFKQPSWGGKVDGKLDLSQISEFSIYINEIKGQTKQKQGTLVYDDIEAVK